MTDAAPLLDVSQLRKYFPVRKGLFSGAPEVVHAVDGVSFRVARGETLGLVGESGSGKTTIGRLLLRAIDPDSGAVVLSLADGQTIDLTALRHRDLRPLRRHMQMIFQDPYSSLNPRMTIRDVIADPLLALDLARGSDVDERVIDIARRCQLNIEHLRRFPHAFSGGQRQRISIARALVTRPQFVVCDEAVSALDVSIRAEILNLLRDLQRELGLTYLFISHDLRTVEYLSDRVAVLYLGQFVELAPAARLFARPLHPYTAALMSAIPEPNPSRPMTRIALQGEIPSQTHPPSGCRFHPRCPHAQPVCAQVVPAWQEHAPGHFAACHFAGELNFTRQDA